MPVDYSKWDNLELSDDSDIEVHPNVDKKSFIRAKQNKIHQERQQRRAQIETLKYERIINDGLMKRISALLASLQSHAATAGSSGANPGEIAFRAVMESASSLDPKDDQPRPRPAGLHGAEEPMPTYTKMMAALLDDVNKTMNERKVEQEKRYEAMVEEVGVHLKKVQDLQKELLAKLAELEKEEGRKITSDDIHTGFDSSHVNKAKSEPAASSSSGVELLNPNYSLDSSGKLQGKDGSAAATIDDDEEIVASPLAKQFAKIKPSEYITSRDFLSKHPSILSEKETDGLLVMAFDAQLEGRGEFARSCVHQALLIQYCRALGRDGVSLFFKRIMTPGHQAQKVFHDDVGDTYNKIRTRAKEINEQRAKDIAEGRDPDAEGVAQIQLQAVEPGTAIQVTVPAAGSEDPGEQAARAIFEAFEPDMKKALESGSLDEVNKVLGRMKAEDAEVVVDQMNEAGILGIEELIDATTEEGKQHLEDLKKEAVAEAAAKTSGEASAPQEDVTADSSGSLKYDDPE